MGNSESQNALDQFYERYFQKQLKNPYVEGGALGGALGGAPAKYDNLKDYADSAHAMAKEELIRSLAEDLAASMGMKAEFARNAKIEDVVKEMKKKIPQPSNKKSLKANAALHSKLCQNMAKSINKRYDAEMIPMDDKPEDICRKVSELLYSLFNGLHSEFLEVSGDISRILSNLRILQQYVDGANKKLMADLDKKNGAETGDSKYMKELYSKISGEISRQTNLLENLTDSVIGPLNKSLIKLLEDNKDFTGVVQDMKGLVGTSEFSDRLSHLLLGMSAVARSAELVNDALAKLGMSLGDYKNAKGLKDLQDKVYDLVKSKAKSEDAAKLMAAAEVLYKNEMDKDEIVEQLEKKKGGYFGGDSFADMADEMTKSGSNNSPFKGRIAANRQSIDKQIEKKQKFRKLLFKDFNLKLKSHYQRITASLAKLSKKIGSSIPIDDNLNMFLKQLVLFGGIQPETRADLFVALTGYKNTTESNYSKYKFLENLRQMSETLEHLLKGKGGESFKDIKNSMDDMVKLVDDFNDTFSKPLREFGANINRDVVDGGATCGGDCGVCGGDGCPLPRDDNLDSSEQRAELQMADAVDADMGLADEVADRVGGGAVGGNVFEQLSAIENTDVASGQMGILGGVIDELDDGEIKYFQTMGTTIREFEYYYKIAGIEDNMKKMSKDVDANTENYESILGEEAGAIIDKVQQKYAAELIRLDAIANKDDDKDGASRFLLEYVRSSKIEMMEAAQAMDLYLSKFTKQIQLKPNEIKKFAQIVEDVVVIANWFNEQAGDDLLAVFGGDNVEGALNELTRDKAIEYVKKIEKALKGMRALENIISVFSKVNVKVSSDIKTFMSPGMIFKAFMKYLVASSVAMKSDPNGYYSVQLANRCDAGESSEDKMFVDNNDKAIDDALDEIFRSCLKSMASKVFVVVGNYSLFNRPARQFSASDALPNTPLRQIMGGSKCEDAIPEASELYLRLPLLAEWYRDVFDFKSNDAEVNDNPLISHIPDMDGVWREFANIMFWDARNTNGSYPVAYAERIVKSINQIYKHFPGKSCRDIIDEFILEINRRYGFMMRSEIQDYIAEKGDSELLEHTDMDKLDDDGNDLEDYDILGANDSMGRRSAPSDRYRAFKMTKADEKRSLKLFHDAVKNFRGRVERKLSLGNGELDIMQKFDQTSLNNVIRQVERRMKNASSPDERCAIVMEQLHGVDKYGDVDKHRVMMFHEAVITPLTVLRLVERKLSILKQDVGAAPSLSSLLNSLMNMGVDLNGLVELYVAGSGDNRHPVLNFSKLEEHCRRLFEQAKTGLKEMRKFLPNALVQRYEDVANNLSIVRIERDLFDILFKNKNKQGLEKVNNDIRLSYADLRLEANGDYEQLVLWDENDAGLASQLNSVIRSYLTVMKDGSSDKHYKPLLEKFAFGHNAKEVVQGKGLVKVNAGEVDKDDNILFADLADRIKQIMTEKYNPDRPDANVPKYLEDDLDKIPSYQQEMMRAYLPVYAKHLDIICKRAEFLKSLIDQTSLVLALGDESEAVAKGKFTHLLDEVCATARSLGKCIKGVEKEISDVPLYMEIYADSLKDYQSRNGNYPFMPLSNLTHLMVGNKIDLLVPADDSAIGSTAFKMAYGTRGILNPDQKVSMDYMPGMSTILDVFHSKLGSEMSFPKARMNELVQDMVPLMRYVIDIQVHNKALSGKVAAMESEQGYSCQASGDSYWSQSQNITLLVENDNLKEAINRLMGCASNVGGLNKLNEMSRETLRVYNILDLNVVPINFHAMQREIAFVNLLNYSYTFDQLVDRAESNASLRAQLKSPMADNAVLGDVESTLKGNRDLGIPIPKYLKDQLVDKVGIMEGSVRYNKKLVRNIIFIAHLQKAVRKLIRKQLEWNKDPVVVGHPIVNEDITDYTENNSKGNPPALDKDYFN